MAVDRRALWLGATLIVAIVGVMVVRSTGNAPPTAPPERRPAARAQRAAAVEAGDAAQPPLDLNLEALSRERGEPVDQGRNPFQFRPKPAPAPPPAPPPSMRPPNETVMGPVAPIVPAGPPPPPPILLKFIGIVQKADGTKIAVLSDGKRPIYGSEGEEIDGRYKIWKIGLESIELSYIDGRGRQTLRLSGQ
jgi:hypothetical protein